MTLAAEPDLLIFRLSVPPKVSFMLLVLSAPFFSEVLYCSQSYYKHSPHSPHPAYSVATCFGLSTLQTRPHSRFLTQSLTYHIPHHPPVTQETLVQDDVTAHHVPKSRRRCRVNRKLQHSILGMNEAQSYPSGTSVPPSQNNYCRNSHVARDHPKKMARKKKWYRH